MNELYGDGIHDDTQAIQDLIDVSGSQLNLPMPEKYYLISKPIELPSDFKLIVPRFAEIRLAKNSNCVMLKNKTALLREERTNVKLFDFVNEFSPNAPCENIEVEGGIWNLNNKEQNSNPLLNNLYEPRGYNGFIFLFYNVKNLRINSLTLKDPITFAVTLDTVSYFTIDNIIFDFNYGNPLATNMDGIHLDGNCHFGSIKNLKGACYDDLVALNADEGSMGEISDITISEIYSEDCHSAIRLLSANYPVKNIHISNVYGTYFQYCIGLTRFYATKSKGIYDGITIDNVYASKAKRLPIYNKSPNSYIYPLIFIESKLNIKALKITDLHRREELIPVETIYIGENTEIEQLILENITTENNTGSETMPLLVNKGKIDYFYSHSLFEDGKQYKVTC